ncbi:hypothetical protein WHR41_04487 [Cladosporium halotolerans]|uniref:Cyanovirin-N domain-containing protein n=1 Tax=Cladosporium halotolerans TaxID=1052096 RepID=A0AB34KNM3_9PEZI
MSSQAADAYPRPDFTREQSWVSLNGPWDFVFDDKDEGLDEQWHKNGIPKNVLKTIQVPYVFQAPASGINEQSIHEVLWYERAIEDPRTSSQKDRKDRILARFGAVDYECTVWVDGSYVGGHRGGHVPFDIDITDAFSGQAASHKLTLRVFDSATDVTQPRGKQFWGPKPESIFYTPSSGIWQNVWLESVPATRLADSSNGTILRSHDIESGTLHATVAVLGRKAGEKYSVQLESSFAGKVVATSSKAEMPVAKRIALNLGMRMSPEQLKSLPEDVTKKAPLDNDMAWLNGVALWSPDFPQLYDITIRLFDGSDKQIDEAKTTTGMRQISWANGDGTLRLNNHPYFQALLLDQGYWPSSLMTPPTPTALKEDIELSKAMGFNGCRKHQKVEDPRFHYWADRLGFLVWGEMASPYDFGGEMTARFDQEWTEAVKRDINHPCVVAWTTVNESWGYSELSHNPHHRNHVRSLYYQTKTLDPTRPINDNCGWEHVATDLTTFHDYADAPTLAQRTATLHSITTTGRPLFLPPTNTPPMPDAGSAHTPHAPVFCSEFGGVNITSGASGADPHHERGWGYTTASSTDDLLARFAALCGAVVHSGLCGGFVYTQTTDIEQETNGLYTYDRRPKMPAEQVRGIVAKAAETYLAAARKGMKARAAVFRGGLADAASVRGLRVEGGRWLVGECAVRYGGQGEGEWRESRLDLDACFVNTWGKVTWQRGGGVVASCRGLGLVGGEGTVMEVEAGDGKSWQRNLVRLEERVGNVGGELVFE